MIFLAMDDTDVLGSRGTGKLARSVGASLADQYTIQGISRHQLFVHEAIPFTSHNSCAVLHICTSGRENAKHIFSLAKEIMLNDFIEGSDPGITVAEEHQITPALVAYGYEAKKSVLNQEMARSLAADLGITLQGLGGTEDGVIGAMAGLGLASTQNDGRYIMKGTIRDLLGPTPAEILLKAGIDQILTKDGEEIHSGTIFVREGKSVKPCPVEGKAVLFVEKRDDGRLHAIKRN